MPSVNLQSLVQNYESSMLRTLQDEGLSSVTAGQKRYPSIAGANID